MKKTFLSFLLGAIVIASTSVFVSCQDYDDEYRGLSEQISTNKKAFEDQVAALNAEIGKLQAQHAADVKALNAADSTLAGLISKEVADAKAYALAEAQKAYDNAVKYADEAAQKAAYETLEAAKAYADQVAAAQAQKEAQAVLVAANEAAQAQLTQAKKEIEAAIEAMNEQHAKDVAELQAEDAKIWEAINAAKALVAASVPTLEAAATTAAEAKTLAETNAKALETVSKSYADLAASVEAQGNQVAQAIKDNQAINDKIAALNKTVEDNAKDAADKYNTLVNSMNVISKNVSALESALADAQAQIAKNAEDIAAANAQIVTLSAQVNALEKALVDSIASVEEDVETAMTAAILLAGEAYTNAVADAAENAAAGDAALDAKIKANAKAIEDGLKDCAEAEKALAKKIADLKSEIDTKLADYATIAYVDGKFGSYYTIAQADSKIAAAVEDLPTKDDVDEMIKAAMGTATVDLSALYQNDLEVITDVHYYGAAGEVKCDYTKSFDYLPGWADVTFNGKDVKADQVTVDGSVKEESTITPAYIYFLLNPTTVEHFNQMYLIDEKAEHHPYFYVGKAQKVVDKEREELPYFNTRTQKGGNDVENTPVYKASVTVDNADIDWAKVIADPTYAPFAAQDAALDATKQLFAPVAEYNAIREQDGEVVKEYCYGEFAFDPTKIAVKTAFVVDSTKVTCDATDKDFGFDAKIENTYDLSLTFKDQNNDKIYKQVVACIKAFDGCDTEAPAAVTYMNGLYGEFEDVLEAGALENGLTGKSVAKEYDFYTFIYEYQVFDRDGDHFEYFDTVQIMPTIATKYATFDYLNLEPTSAAVQTTAAQDVEAALVWNNSYKDCKNFTVEFAPISEAAKKLAAGIQFDLAGAKVYDAPTAAVTTTYTKAEADAVTKLSVKYDPAQLTVGDVYSYTVTVKQESTLISVSTINVSMVRPAFWFDPVKITSTWNKDKTRTIAWAKANVRSEYSNAWYDLNGSFTNLPDATENPDAEGNEFVLSQKGYVPATLGDVVTMPETANEYIMEVVPEAVSANVAEAISWDAMKAYYTLEYGTNVFGLESLYGAGNGKDDKVGQFEIAYLSPIYYDGYKWNFGKQTFEGGCYLKGDVNVKAGDKNYAVFQVEFPEQETTIDSKNFIGSDDPSTSYYDPIKYFGTIATLDDPAAYAAYYAEREAKFISGTYTGELTYQDARILDIVVEQIDATKVPAEVVDAVAEHYGVTADAYVWNDPTNEYLFEVKPTLDITGGIYFKTYNKYPSLQSIPAFYYNMTVIDIWGCKKEYPFIITINPNE